MLKRDTLIVWLWANFKQVILWTSWLVLSFFALLYLSHAFVAQPTVFMPDKLTDAHHQITQQCQQCHREPLQSVESACLTCHQAELKAVNDSHAANRFDDPRYRSKLAQLDASKCVTCHLEHKPERLTEANLTVPASFCATCHTDIRTELSSHRDFDFNSCRQCHNYHDNTMLYKDFLKRHQGAYPITANPSLPLREKTGQTPLDLSRALNLSQQDSPPSIPLDLQLAETWAHSAHARNGVNCSACHIENQEDGKQGAWIQKPNYRLCMDCHEQELSGFWAGKHGMRLAYHHSPMLISEARLPMQATAQSREMGCNACHTAHRFDVIEAAVDSCLGCHADEHSLAYKNSPHARLWYEGLAQERPLNQGVSCANCHLPRIQREQGVFVQHNQNANLRPNQKMLKDVCLYCHSAEFSLAALGDKRLIRNNFQGRPPLPLELMQMLP